MDQPSPLAPHAKLPCRTPASSRGGAPHATGMSRRSRPSSNGRRRRSTNSSGGCGPVMRSGNIEDSCNGSRIRCARNGLWTSRDLRHCGFCQCFLRSRRFRGLAHLRGLAEPRCDDLGWPAALRRVDLAAGRNPMPKNLASTIGAPLTLRLRGSGRAANDARKVHALVVDASFGASSAGGLLRRSVVTIGLPFWSILSPQERVALLAQNSRMVGTGIASDTALSVAPSTRVHLSPPWRPAMMTFSP